MEISKYLYFVVGAAAGSVVTFFAAKSYYQKKAEEAINEVREYYKKEEEEVPTVEETEEKEQIVYTEGYSTPEQVKSYQPEDLVPNIHEISEEEYGNEEGYEAIPTYIYHSDGIIVDGRLPMTYYRWHYYQWLYHLCFITNASCRSLAVP